MMYACWSLLLAFLTLSLVKCDSVFTVGLQSIVGPQWLDTFGPFLTNNTPYDFQSVLYANDTVMLQDAAAGKLNFTYAGPVQYLCLALGATTSDGIAGVVSSSYIDGAPVERLAGAILVPFNSTINTVHDLRGKLILTGPISSLSTFAVQWQVLQQQNVNLFKDTQGIFLQSNITQIMPDLLSGLGDVAFVPAGYLERYYSSSSSLFRCINQMNSTGYPYVHSTALYPNSVMSALDTTPFQVRRSIAQALFAIQPGDPITEDGKEYGFTPLGAYTSVRTLMSTIGLLNNSTQCRTISALVDLVQCPPGYVRVGDAAVSCVLKGISCPPS